VVSRNRQNGWPEPPEESGGPLELVTPPAMREVARRDHELRLGTLDEPCERRRHVDVLMLAHMEVGDVEDACCHGRTRL
jgi:hypothetical protein